MSETRHFHILLLDNDLENDQKYFLKEEEEQEEEEQEEEEQEEQVIPLETLWNRQHQVSCRGQKRFRGLNVIICKPIWYNIEKSKTKPCNIKEKGYLNIDCILIKQKSLLYSIWGSKNYLVLL